MATKNVFMKLMFPDDLCSKNYSTKDPNSSNLTCVIFNSLRNRKKMRRNTNFYYLLKLFILCSCLLYILYIASQQQQKKAKIKLGSEYGVKKIPPKESKRSIQKGFTDSSYRVFHLDLKGGPPKLEYLKRLLPMLATVGCDCILMEYEDMFPYTGKLANISAQNAYTKEEIKKILSWAHDLSIEVIPLVQTFGQFEHALKLEEWKHLREVANDPSVLCPIGYRSTSDLVKDMIDQVITIHKGIRYLHIGGAEVKQIGVCRECSNFNPMNLYADHMTSVAKTMRDFYPNLTVIIWDEMLRNWDPYMLATTKLVDLVELMIWDYDNALPSLVWYWYTKTFKRIWVTSAFKGAESSMSDLPNLYKRYYNTKVWLAKIHNAQVPIAGFVLTGRSRYDHFSQLCELLPSSIPSLLLNLIAISKSHTNQPDEEKVFLWQRALKCPTKLSFSTGSILKDQREILDCKFSSIDFYSFVLHYNDLKLKINTVYDILTKHHPWMVSYNTKHNFTNPLPLLKEYGNFQIYSQLSMIKKLKNITFTVLSNYTDYFTINEWIEQRIIPLEEKLESVRYNIQLLLTKSKGKKASGLS